MLYFAYGSNMDWDQMRDRCKSANFVCNARLNDYRLVFSRSSVRRGCGVADVTPTQGEDTWGVVYKIAEEDIGHLDASEGYKPGRSKHENPYNREERIVFADGDERKPLTVAIYIAEKQESPPPPNGEYKSLMIEGARFWHLPESYINQLQKIETAP